MNITCKNCHKPFVINRKKRIFCSLKCSIAFNKPTKYSVCKNCKKSFKNHLWVSKNVFCTQSCYDQFRKAKTTKSICNTCGVEFIRPDWKCKIRKNKYCSLKCLRNRPIKKNYRNIVKNKLNEPCEICSKSKKVEVHHIDGNRLNNNSSNFIIICRSCHMFIHGLHTKYSLSLEDSLKVYKNIKHLRLAGRRSKLVIAEIEKAVCQI